MSIKQHGGVFGRNPSFNNVEVESLSIAGNAVPDASTILVDGDIGSTVQGYDADTAKLDVAQNFTASQAFPAVSVKKDTGTSPIDPATLEIRTTTNGSGWSTTDPWGRVTFFSEDNSDDNDKIHAQMTATAAKDTGGFSSLAFDIYSTGTSQLENWLTLQNSQFSASRRVVVNAESGLNVASLGTGTVYSSSGTLTNTNPSDLNLKENVVEINYGLSEVKQLRPVEFDWIAGEEDKHELGFIAQEVQLVIPDLVSTYERIIDEETSETEIGYGLESTQFVPVLVKAIQEQQAIIESLESRISALESD